MKKKDWVKRINRQIGGDKTWMLIERRKCTNPSCRKTHRLLPDISIPYKHYDAGVIEDVIDGTIDEDALCEEENPSESTMMRWRKWAEAIRGELEGHIRSAAYRILELSDKFLGSRVSLLGELKERIGYGWLSAAMRICINGAGP